MTLLWIDTFGYAFSKLGIGLGGFTTVLEDHLKEGRFI